MEAVAEMGAQLLEPAAAPTHLIQFSSLDCVMRRVKGIKVPAGHSKHLKVL
jgi:hypothetical protein